MPTELLVSRVGGQTWAALREHGSTVELRVETASGPVAAGHILKGRVTKVLAGIQSAFVDVGLDRDAFLFGGDLMLPGEEPEPETVDLDRFGAAEEAGDGSHEEVEDVPGPFRRVRPRQRGRPIQDRLSVGVELVVQVSREPLGVKGARVTSILTLPGRYLVHAPQLPFRGVSRRIHSPEERARLREVLGGLMPGSGGFIVRTAGEGAPASAFQADAVMLRQTWDSIQSRAVRMSAPSVLHSDLDLLLRLLRDAPREGLDTVVVSDREDHDRAVEYLRELEPTLASRVRLHTGRSSLFEEAGVLRDLERALRPKVWLPSGGYLMIQPTEALVAIDVNTGKFLGETTPEATSLRTNLEAAQEIARQLRLRDLGGIVVIDFIDMQRPESRGRVLDVLGEALQSDRARTRLIGMSELGLVQLTRKRTRPGVEAALTRTCPHCLGLGRVKSPETVAFEVLTEIGRLGPHASGGRVTVRVHPDVARALRLSLQTAGLPVGEGSSVDVRVEEDSSALPDQFDMLAI